MTKRLVLKYNIIKKYETIERDLFYHTKNSSYSALKSNNLKLYKFKKDKNLEIDFEDVELEDYYYAYYKDSRITFSYFKGDDFVEVRTEEDYNILFLDNFFRKM